MSLNIYFRKEGSKNQCSDIVPEEVRKEDELNSRKMNTKF